MPTGTARGFTCSPHREPVAVPTIGAFAQRWATPPRPSLIVPRPNGAPMLLRNAPTRATGTPQTSTSMPLPAPGMRTSPGALAIRQRGNQRVMKSRREQGHRGRQTVRLEAVGDRDRRQV